MPFISSIPGNSAFGRNNIKIILPPITTIYSATGSYAIPSGYRTALIEAWGGGSNGIYISNGGSGGSYCSCMLSNISNSSTLYFVVGVGGTGGTDSTGGHIINPGGASWCNLNSNTTPTSSTTGVYALGGQLAGTNIGLTIYVGGSGGSNAGGGGGSSATKNGVGGNGISGNTTGAGGSAPGGGAGGVRTAGSRGGNGVNNVEGGGGGAGGYNANFGVVENGKGGAPGGGGGGSSSPGYPGGSGGIGQVRITIS
jgi:hypothetical protein